MLLRMNKYVLCFLGLFLWVLPNVKAQKDDNIAWLSMSSTTKIQKDLSFTLTPIIRLNEDFESYQNFSLDYAFKRKINTNWSAVLFGRTWFLPDGTNRQFLWVDATYSQKLKDISWSHRVRFHQAFDINEVTDPDYIRYFQQIKYTGWGKFQPVIGLELWYGLNGISQFERLRYTPGFAYKFNDAMTLSAVLWRQETINLDNPIQSNIYRINLAFNLPALWIEK